MSNQAAESVEQSGIRWRLHFIMMSVIGWYAYSAYDIQTSMSIDRQDQLIELVRMFGAYQAWFGIAVLVAATTHPLVISTFTSRDVTKIEDDHCNLAAAYGFLVLAIGWAVYAGWEYGYFNGNILYLLLANGATFLLLTRPAAKHIIYGMGIWWFAMSLVTMVLMVVLAGKLSKK